MHDGKNADGLFFFLHNFRIFEKKCAFLTSYRRNVHLKMFNLCHAKIKAKKKIQYNKMLCENKDFLWYAIIFGFMNF